MQGKIVASIQHSNQVNITELPAGMYLMLINTAEGIFQKEIIKE